MPMAAWKRWQTSDWPLAVEGSDGNAKAGNSIVKLDRENCSKNWTEKISIERMWIAKN
jgi:hypothetical protein